MSFNHLLANDVKILRSSNRHTSPKIEQGAGDRLQNNFITPANKSDSVTFRHTQPMPD
jgi:hypothetical protein